MIHKYDIKLFETIKDNPYINVNRLSKMINVSRVNTSRRINNHIRRGFIHVNMVTSNRQLYLSDKGIKLLEILRQ